jgi:hypothetical protein
MTTKGLSAALKDSSMPDEFKRKLLQENGYSPEMAQRIIGVVNNSLPKHEAGYEQYVRDPARQALTKVTGHPGLANWAVPENLQAAGEMVGGLGGPPGVFLGGMIGGHEMGRTVPQSAERAIPDALLAHFVPKIVKRVFAGPLERASSAIASTKIGAATGKLFKLLYKDNPEFKVPTTPQELADFYGQGRASKALSTAGEKLGDLRRILSTQPAFKNQMVPVPLRYLDAATNTYKMSWTKMPMDDAIEYQMALSDKTYLPSGKMRASIPAGGDRAAAARVRQNILLTLRQMPRKIGATQAQRYEDLSRDYGVASIFNEAFDPKTVTPGQLLDHERLYQNFATNDRMSHLANLVGEGPARDFLNQVAPGRARIQPSGITPLHPHIGPVGVSIPVKTPAIAPPEFSSSVPGLAGAAAGTVGAQTIEKNFP